MSTVIQAFTDPPATTSTLGVVLKSTSLSASAGTTLTDNTGGSVIVTLPAITGAVYATDSPGLKNALSTLISGLNTTNARLEDLIAKQKTAGQQT